jgi:hypothetical protein
LRIVTRYLFNIFIPQLVTKGLEIIERVDKLQGWEHLGLSSRMKQTTLLKTEGELQRKKLNEK